MTAVSERVPYRTRGAPVESTGAAPFKLTSDVFIKGDHWGHCLARQTSLESACRSRRIGNGLLRLLGDDLPAATRQTSYFERSEQNVTSG